MNTLGCYTDLMDKEKRRIQSETMKREHRARNLAGIALIHIGRWRGTMFVNGIAQHKNSGNIFLHPAFLSKRHSHHRK